MAKFSYEQYEEAENAAKSISREQSNRVGYFKLADDGDEALVRFKISSLDDLEYASVHNVKVGDRRLQISCLAPLTAGGGNSSDSCPLCAAHKNGNALISGETKRVYLKLLVSYLDKSTGTWSAPQAAVWNRPISFRNEIANKLKNFGDLSQCLLKVTRLGKANDLKTTYSLDYAVPNIYKPEMIPADFSAFDNFDLSKHSYYEKTADEIEQFLITGSFPVNDSNRQQKFLETDALPPLTDPNSGIVETPTMVQQAVVKDTFTQAQSTAKRFTF